MAQCWERSWWGWAEVESGGMAGKGHWSNSCHGELWSCPSLSHCFPSLVHSLLRLIFLLLVLDELIQFPKLKGCLVVLLSWNPLIKESKDKVRCGTGNKRARREAGAGRKILHLNFSLNFCHCLGVGHLAVTEGWSRKDRHEYVPYNPHSFWSNCIGKESTLHTISAVENCGGWQMKKGKRDLLGDGRGTDQARHP